VNFEDASSSWLFKSNDHGRYFSKSKLSSIALASHLSCTIVPKKNKWHLQALVQQMTTLKKNSYLLMSTRMKCYSLQGREKYKQSILLHATWSDSGLRENRQLVTDELAEFEE
jgi:hypothetical protein